MLIIGIVTDCNRFVTDCCDEMYRNPVFVTDVTDVTDFLEKVSIGFFKKRKNIKTPV